MSELDYDLSEMIVSLVKQVWWNFNEDHDENSDLFLFASVNCMLIMSKRNTAHYWR